MSFATFGNLYRDLEKFNPISQRYKKRLVFLFICNDTFLSKFHDHFNHEFSLFLLGIHTFGPVSGNIISFGIIFEFVNLPNSQKGNNYILNLIKALMAFINLYFPT